MTIAMTIRKASSMARLRRSTCEPHFLVIVISHGLHGVLGADCEGGPGGGAICMFKYGGDGHDFRARYSKFLTSCTLIMELPLASSRSSRRSEIDLDAVRAIKSSNVWAWPTMRRAYRPRLSKDKAVAQRVGAELDRERHHEFDSVAWQMAALGAHEDSSSTNTTRRQSKGAAIAPMTAVELNTGPVISGAPRTATSSASKGKKCAQRNAPKRRESGETQLHRHIGNDCTEAMTIQPVSNNRKRSSVIKSKAAAPPADAAAAVKPATLVPGLTRRRRAVPFRALNSTPPMSEPRSHGGRRCSSTVRGDDWACVSCSFLNSGTAKKCRMCSTKNFHSSSFTPPSTSAVHMTAPKDIGGGNGPGGGVAHEPGLQDVRRRRDSDEGCMPPSRGADNSTLSISSTARSQSNVVRVVARVGSASERNDDESFVCPAVDAGGDVPPTSVDGRNPDPPCQEQSDSAHASSEADARDKEKDEHSPVAGITPARCMADEVRRTSLGGSRARKAAAAVASLTRRRQTGGTDEDHHDDGRLPDREAFGVTASRARGHKRARVPNRVALSPAVALRSSNTRLEMVSPGHDRREVDSLSRRSDAALDGERKDAGQLPADRVYLSNPEAMQNQKRYRPVAMVTPLTGDGKAQEEPEEGKPDQEERQQQQQEKKQARSSRKRPRPNQLSSGNDAFDAESVNTHDLRTTVAANSTTSSPSSNGTRVANEGTWPVVDHISRLDFSSLSTWEVSSVIVLDGSHRRRSRGGDENNRGGRSASGREAAIIICHAGGVSVWGLTDTEAVCTHLSPSLSGDIKESVRGRFHVAAVVGEGVDKVNTRSTKALGHDRTRIIAIGRHEADSRLPLIRVWQGSLWDGAQRQYVNQVGNSNATAASRGNGDVSAAATATRRPPTVLKTTLKKKFSRFSSPVVPRHVAPCLCVCGHSVKAESKRREIEAGEDEEDTAGFGETTIVVALGGKAVRSVLSAGKSGLTDVRAKALPTGSLQSEAVCTSLAPVPSNPFLVWASFPASNAVLLWDVRKLQLLTCLPLCASRICVPYTPSPPAVAATQSPLPLSTLKMCTNTGDDAGVAGASRSNETRLAAREHGSSGDNTKAVDAVASGAPISREKLVLTGSSLSRFGVGLQPRMLCMLAATSGTCDADDRGRGNRASVACRFFGVFRGVEDDEGGPSARSSSVKISAVELGGREDSSLLTKPDDGDNDDRHKRGENDHNAADSHREPSYLGCLCDSDGFVASVDETGRILARDTRTGECRVLVTPADATTANEGQGNHRTTTRSDRIGFASIDSCWSDGIAAVATGGLGGSLATAVDLYLMTSREAEVDLRSPT